MDGTSIRQTLRVCSDTRVSIVHRGAGTAWHLLDTSRAVRPLVLQEPETYEFQPLTPEKSEFGAAGASNPWKASPR